MAISKKRRFQVLERDGFRCRYCGTSGSAGELHVDHVMPVSRGGSDDMNNLVASCHACNLGKGALLLKGGVDPRDGMNLIGLMCHGIENGEIVYQGQIRKQVGKSSYLIQFYNWLDGGPAAGKVVDLSDESTIWNFYMTQEEMRHAYYTAQGMSPDDIKWAEMVIGVAS